MPENRVVLITGASSGFGRETARLLLGRGYRVYGTSRNPSAKPQESGVGIMTVDVDSDSSVENGVKELLDEAGRLDVLVNNAGYVLTGGAEETSIAEAKAQFETDFFGPVRMAKTVLPIMRKQGTGQIINLSLRQRATAKLDEDFENGADPKIVAETVLRIITSKNPKLEYAVGSEKRYKTLKHLMPQSIIENGVRRHWKLDG